MKRSAGGQTHYFAAGSGDPVAADHLRAPFDIQAATHQAVRKYDIRGRLPLIKVPTLFVQSLGRLEPIFFQRGNQLQKLVPGSQVASIQDGDIHVIHFRAEEVSRILLDFFRKRS